LRVDKLDQLWDLDDGCSGDDGDTESFGDGELDAGFVGSGEVELLDERSVTLLADEGDCEIFERTGQVVGYRGEDWLERGDDTVEDVHDVFVLMLIKINVVKLADLTMTKNNERA